MAERRWRALATEVWRFGVIGGLTYVVDTGLSNLLVYGLGPVPALLPDAPLVAKSIAFLVAMVLAWAGNRWWTYGHRETGSSLRSVGLYLLVNLASMVIVLIPAGVSWYLLGLQDPVSFNISTNVIGFVLGLLFRFWAYRTWVFRDQREPDAVPTEEVR
ncbi:GtrA family protein [Desertihabitans brevis]|uniref:GtrA family protein n=1 Tax=Desertihabitans brevis TaxID=2268447 RepID=A0A367YSU8_9ACTN|nr:GtrA family protein [Desertihabitans brevis]RCK68102.1 GtrA family protein [Desertihabitans brevis]